MEDGHHKEKKNIYIYGRKTIYPSPYEKKENEYRKKERESVTPTQTHPTLRRLSGPGYSLVL